MLTKDVKPNQIVKTPNGRLRVVIGHSGVPNLVKVRTITNKATDMHAEWNENVADLTLVVSDPCEIKTQR